MVTQSEAEEHIEPIPKVSLITYGTLILLIPGFEYLLNFFEFGGTIWAHLIFYVVLFSLVREFLIRKIGTWRDTATHPVLNRALLAQQKFAALSSGLSTIALAHSGNIKLIFPVVTLHLAALFYSFGKFSSKDLRRMAYAQVLIATLAIEVLSTPMGGAAFPVFTTLLALTFFGGAYLR